MGCHPSNWQTHIFQDGYCTTKYFPCVSAMPAIDSFQALTRAIEAADIPSVAIPAEWHYLGANPAVLRQHIRVGLNSAPAPKDSSMDLLRMSILVHLLGTRKAEGLGSKESKYSESVSKAVKAQAKASGKFKTLQGYSLNAASSALPELGVIFLSSSTGKPTPSLQQLNLRPGLRMALRARDRQLLDKEGQRHVFLTPHRVCFHPAEHCSGSRRSFFLTMYK